MKGIFLHFCLLVKLVTICQICFLGYKQRSNSLLIYKMSEK